MGGNLDMVVMEDLSEEMSGDLKEEKEIAMCRSMEHIQVDGSASASFLKWEQAEGISGIARRLV